MSANESEKSVVLEATIALLNSENAVFTLIPEAFISGHDGEISVTDGFC